MFDNYSAQVWSNLLTINVEIIHSHPWMTYTIEIDAKALHIFLSPFSIAGKVINESLTKMLAFACHDHNPSGEVA